MLAPAQIREYGIVARDREGRVVSWNAGAERVTGYVAAAELGRGISVRSEPGVGTTFSFTIPVA